MTFQWPIRVFFLWLLRNQISGIEGFSENAILGDTHINVYGIQQKTQGYTRTCLCITSESKQSIINIKLVIYSLLQHIFEEQHMYPYSATVTKVWFLGTFLNLFSGWTCTRASGVTFFFSVGLIADIGDKKLHLNPIFLFTA